MNPRTLQAFREELGGRYRGGTKEAAALAAIAGPIGNLAVNAMGRAAHHDYLPKFASPQDTTRSRAIELAKEVAYPIAGFVGGTALGLGAGMLAGKIYQQVNGHKPSAATWGRLVPPLMLGSALAYALTEREQKEQIRRANEDRSNRGRGGAPR